MSEGTPWTVTPAHRKIMWRTSRMLIMSLLVTLAAGILFGINPFYFWDSPGHVVMILGGWIVVYHIMEAIKRSGA